MFERTLGLTVNAVLSPLTRSVATYAGDGAMATTAVSWIQKQVLRLGGDNHAAFATPGACVPETPDDVLKTRIAFASEQGVRGIVHLTNSGCTASKVAMVLSEGELKDKYPSLFSVELADVYKEHPDTYVRFAQSESAKRLEGHMGVSVLMMHYYKEDRGGWLSYNEDGALFPVAYFPTHGEPQERELGSDKFDGWLRDVIRREKM
jgi:hypothetical protein